MSSEYDQDENQDEDVTRYCVARHWGVASCCNHHWGGAFLEKNKEKNCKKQIKISGLSWGQAL